MEPCGGKKKVKNVKRSKGGDWIGQLRHSLQLDDPFSQSINHVSHCLACSAENVSNRECLSADLLGIERWRDCW